MKSTKIFLVTLLTGLFLVGCGGNGNSTSAVPTCGSGDDQGKSNAVAVNGKTIEKTEENAQVRIWHYPSGDKLACMISGEANLVDNN